MSENCVWSLVAAAVERERERERSALRRVRTVRGAAVDVWLFDFDKRHTTQEIVMQGLTGALANK